MFNTLIEGAAFKAGVTASADNGKSIFDQFNTSTLQSTAELFIEAP
jgi:hypothetical protein